MRRISKHTLIMFMYIYKDTTEKKNLLENMHTTIERMHSFNGGVFILHIYQKLVSYLFLKSKVSARQCYFDPKNNIVLLKTM